MGSTSRGLRDHSQIRPPFPAGSSAAAKANHQPQLPPNWPTFSFKTECPVGWAGPIINRLQQKDFSCKITEEHSFLSQILKRKEHAESDAR